jgi:predicted amidohydrolase YtcJ
MRFIPVPSPQQFYADCQDTLHTWASTGVTTICDASVGGFSPYDLQIFQQLATESTTPIRLRAALVPDNDYPIKNGLTPGKGDDRLSFLAIKFWADGSTQGFTGAVNEPFLNQMGNGKLNYEEEELCARMQRWHDAGWQLIIHTNGDRASDQVLRCFERILQQTPRPDHRHRLDHFTVTSEAQIEKAKELGLGVSHTMGHVYYWGETFRDHVLGLERASRIDPLASDFQRDLVVSLHSDSPVTPPSPLIFLQTAVTRRMRNSGEILGPDQCIPLDAALKTITLYPAYQLRMEDKVGSFEVGKLADMVLLDKNPRTVDPNALSHIAVLATFLEGKQVWSKDGNVATGA